MRTDTGPWSIRQASAEDLPLLLRLQATVASTLEVPALFQTSTVEFFRYCLTNRGGRTYLAYNDERHPVGYRIVYFPHERSFNLGKHVGLKPEEFDRVAHFDTLAVLAPLRGRGVARALNQRTLTDLAALTQARHLFATTAPQNTAGLAELMACGFRPIRLIEVTGGWPRLLCYRPNPEPWDDRHLVDSGRCVPIFDLYALGKALVSTHCGVAVERRGFNRYLRIGVACAADQRLGTSSMWPNPTQAVPA